ncbi:MAG: hypothetical protein AAFW98_19500, partial [Pseudomonadota bacterium]
YERAALAGKLTMAEQLFRRERRQAAEARVPAAASVRDAGLSALACERLEAAGIATAADIAAGKAEGVASQVDGDALDNWVRRIVNEVRIDIALDATEEAEVKRRQKGLVERARVLDEEIPTAMLALERTATALREAQSAPHPVIGPLLAARRALECEIEGVDRTPPKPPAPAEARARLDTMRRADAIRQAALAGAAGRIPA